MDRYYSSHSISITSPLTSSSWVTRGPPAPGCMQGKGGVFLSLLSIKSMLRGTFLPSTFTSKEKATNSAFPLILLDTTPPPALPASSPVLILKFESLRQMGFPSHLTVWLPWAVSEDCAMLG